MSIHFFYPQKTTSSSHASWQFPMTIGLVWQCTQRCPVPSLPPCRPMIRRWCEWPSDWPWGMVVGCVGRSWLGAWSDSSFGVKLSKLEVKFPGTSPLVWGLWLKLRGARPEPTRIQRFLLETRTDCIWLAAAFLAMPSVNLDSLRWMDCRWRRTVVAPSEKWMT